MKRIRREEKIFLTQTEESSYDVLNRDGEKLLDSKEDYFIYFKDVNFMKDGNITGRYLGVTDGSLYDNYCKEVRYDNNQWMTTKGSKQVKTARLVMIDNKHKTIVVIENS